MRYKKAGTRALISIIVIATITLFYTMWSVENTPVLEYTRPVVSVSQPVTPEPEPAQITEETRYITQIDNASSEVRGEWLGLCMKDSIKTVDDFHNQVSQDSVLLAHFSNFRWDKAEVRWLPKEIRANVSHRKGDVILPSSKYIKLPKGDQYITDGSRMVRTHCCNDVKPNPDDFQPYTPAPKDPVSGYIVLPTEDPILPVAGTTSTNINIYQMTQMGGGGGGDYRPEPPKPPPPTPTPEPETIVLFAIGLTMLIYSRIKKNKS